MEIKIWGRNWPQQKPRRGSTEEPLAPEGVKGYSINSSSYNWIGYSDKAESKIYTKNNDQLEDLSLKFQVHAEEKIVTSGKEVDDKVDVMNAMIKEYKLEVCLVGWSRVEEGWAHMHDSEYFLRHIVSAHRDFCHLRPQASVHNFS